jgi:twitching motility protein PilI
MSGLRAFAAQPFQLLRELDRRLKGARLDAATGEANVWPGLAFRIGEYWLVTPRTDVREVIQPPRLSRVPNSRPWLSGVANVRGNLLTVVNTGQLLGLPVTGEGRAARVLVLNSERMPVGFVVDEVAGYRQFAPADQRPREAAVDESPLGPCVLGGFQRDGRSWLAFSLHRLAQSEPLRQAGW